jgi:hypothetical protein
MLDLVPSLVVVAEGVAAAELVADVKRLGAEEPVEGANRLGTAAPLDDGLGVLPKSDGADWPDVAVGVGACELDVGLAANNEGVGCDEGVEDTGVAPSPPNRVDVDACACGCPCDEGVGVAPKPPNSDGFAVEVAPAFVP